MSTISIIVIAIVAIVLLTVLVAAMRRRRESRLEDQRTEARLHREESRVRGARADRAAAEADERAASARREQAIAEERAVTADRERRVAEESESRAREIDPDDGADDDVRDTHNSNGRDPASTSREEAR